VAKAIALGGPTVATLDHDGAVVLAGAGGRHLVLVEGGIGNHGRRSPRVVAIAYAATP